MINKYELNNPYADIPGTFINDGKEFGLRDPLII